jgi:peptidyl-prolyl cis-trans isomerase B (cyclophilin B)
MNKVNYNLFAFFVGLGLLAASCKAEKEHLVTIHTKYGDMKMVLYDETPQHKENFIRLAENGKYDQTVFHRVIKEFMVQGGDVSMKSENAENLKNIPAEFVDSFYHHRGAVAAARMPDQMNPSKASSGSQFYIVQGKVFSESELDQMEQNAILMKLQTKLIEMLQLERYSSLREEFIQLQQNKQWDALQQKMMESKDLVEKEFGPLPEKIFTQKQREIYTTLGGSPHLDGEYSVFGKVVDGLHVIDSIAAQKTGPGDRPLEEITMTVKVEQVNKKQLEKLYGLEASVKK